MSAHKKSFNLKSKSYGGGERERELERPVREKAWKERGSEEKGLIETDFNPAGDIRVSYTWGVPGCGNLEGGGEKERGHGGVGGDYICKSF